MTKESAARLSDDYIVKGGCVMAVISAGDGSSHQSRRHAGLQNATIAQERGARERKEIGDFSRRTLDDTSLRSIAIPPGPSGSTGRPGVSRLYCDWVRQKLCFSSVSSVAAHLLS